MSSPRSVQCATILYTLSFGLFGKLTHVVDTQVHAHVKTEVRMALLRLYRVNLRSHVGVRIVYQTGSDIRTLHYLSSITQRGE